MNTKYALFGLCLPFAFAACQNEEIVSSPSVDLESRGVIDVIVSANYPGSVDSRMSATESGNALSFLWEKGTDVLGAAMMDGLEAGTIENTSILANYPFEAQNSGANATFASPSSVTKGIYMFYNSYVDVLDRGSLKIYLADQVYDPASEKTSAQQMVNYMNMIAPMVNLNKGITLKDAAEFVLPLEFANLYTPIKVPVVFKNAPEGTTLKKISINTTGNFKLGGMIDANTIKGAGILTLKDGAIDEEKLSVADAVEALDAAIQTAVDLYQDDTNTEADDVKTGAATLTIKDGVALTNGTAREFWMLIPRGTYSDLIVKVETSNGEMEPKTITINASIEGNPDAKPQEFTSATRSLSNVEVTFGEGGNVKQPDAFTVSSTQEWNDAVTYVMEHITSYVGGDVFFNIPDNKKVYVTSLPDFGFTLSTGSKAKLVLGNADGGAAAISLKNGNIAGTPAIEIGAGATVNMTKDIAGAVITNNGVLNVNLETVGASIVNNATLNINKAKTTLTSLTNDNVVNVNADATLQATAFINKAKYDDNNKYVREGVINVAEEAAFKVEGDNAATIINKGTVELTDNLNNAGTINNYGTLKVGTYTLTNGGKLIVEDGSKSDNGNIDNGGTVEVINPETWKTLQNNTSIKYNVSGAGKTTAVVANRKAFVAANSMVPPMDITLGAGDWNLVDVIDPTTLGDSSRDLDVTNEIPNEISLKGNLVVKAAADLSAKTFNAVGTTTITTNKGVVFKVSAFNVAKDAKATIAAGSKLTVDNVTVTGELTNNGSIEATMVADELTSETINKVNVLINADATLTNAKGANIGGAVNGASVVTVNGKFTNNGTVYAQSTDFNAGNAQTILRGTVKKPSAKVGATETDLSTYTEFLAIEAAGNVTTIPQNVPVTFTGDLTTGLVLNGNEYAALTFKGNATISATSDSKVASISVAAEKTLTVDDSGSKITCPSVSKGANATITDNGSKLLKADGLTPWTL
ncbi:MAG: hypothetical protein E7096_08480 [Bacteroides sp.]|nr:hypothetical protein [Bacteroides sp.]